MPDFDDPNFDPNWTSEFDDDSPYPEVRSAVANTDDPLIPVMTLRSWVLGLVWSVIISGVNQFLSFRYPAVPVVGIVAQLISYPLGCFWASCMPRKRILGISLNPGPFSIKEHVLITVGVLFWTIYFRPFPVVYNFCRSWRPLDRHRLMQ